MIGISDLEFGYPSGGFRLAIDALTVPRGAAVAVVGGSGAGKTTLLHLMAGVLTPGRGRVEIDGTEVSSLDDGKRRAFRIAHIGMVFQEFELLEYLSVLDNVLLPCRISRALNLNAAARERARELLDRVGLADKAARHPRQLSQGERQRVAVCRSLLPDPPVILADEPTGNLDPDNTSRVLDALFGHVADRKATLVGVTHDRPLPDRFDDVIDFARLQGGGHA